MTRLIITAKYTQNMKFMKYIKEMNMVINVLNKDDEYLENYKHVMQKAFNHEYQILYCNNKIQ